MLTTLLSFLLSFPSFFISSHSYLSLTAPVWVTPPISCPGHHQHKEEQWCLSKCVNVRSTRYWKNHVCQGRIKTCCCCGEGKEERREKGVCVSSSSSSSPPSHFCFISLALLKSCSPFWYGLYMLSCGSKEGVTAMHKMCDWLTPASVTSPALCLRGF